MTKKFSSLKTTGFILCIVLISFLFSSCKKNNSDIAPATAAGLMAFNLAPDQPAVSVTLSGNLLGGSSISYGSYTGTYLNIYSGNRQLSSYGASNALLDSLTYPFQQGKYYSVFVVGSGNNYKNVVVQDNYDSLTASSGKAYVRYVNAIAGASASNVTISSAGTNVINAAAPFGQVSPFVAITPGSLNINVSNEGAVNNSRTIAVAQRKAYTILLMGQPGQTDTTRAVQIRFIENGTVAD
jgi:hypothetical protein